MPNDWINLNLSGARAQDMTEASRSFLMNWQTRDWSQALCDMVGVDRRLLPPLRNPGEVLAGLSPRAAALLGLSPGIPALVGCGDCPMALPGSGADAPGMVSDVTGTSSIITRCKRARDVARHFQHDRGVGALGCHDLAGRGR